MCYIYHVMVKPCNTQQAAKAAGISAMTRSKSAMEDSVKREKLFYDVLSGGILYSSLKSSRVPGSLGSKEHSRAKNYPR